jgi:hypothetical protein
MNDIGTGVKAWYTGLPPVSRTYLTLVLVSTLVCFTLGLLDLRHIALIPMKVFKKFEVRPCEIAVAPSHRHRRADENSCVQIWRLVTNFFIIAKPSFKLIIYVTWIVSYMIPLERETYQFEPADFVYMLMFNMLLLNIASLWLGMFFNGEEQGSMHARGERAHAKQNKAACMHTHPAAGHALQRWEWGSTPEQMGACRRVHASRREEWDRTGQHGASRGHMRKPACMHLLPPTACTWVHLTCAIHVIIVVFMCAPGGRMHVHES